MVAIRKQTFECIQHKNTEETVKAYSDFIRRPVEVVEFLAFIVLKSNYYYDVIIYNNDWLIMSWSFQSDGVEVLTDEQFHERYISADNDAVKYGVNSLVFELDEKVDELHNKIEEMSFKEKNFIAQALTHMTSDDIHARVEQKDRPGKKDKL